MVQWETLKLIVTPESNLETILCIIILNVLLFLILGFLSSIILVVVTGGKYIDGTNINNNKLKIGQIIVMITIMFVVTLAYIRYSRETYYTIKVGITTEELQAQEIHDIREMKEFPKKLILEKFIDKDSLERKTKYNYYPRCTRLLNENNNIVFTTKLNIFDYEKYETLEEFKSDIETLAKYTIEYTKEHTKKNQEIMEQFTQEHLTTKGK